MTIKQFLAETTFKHDDVITIVHPTRPHVVLSGDDTSIEAELANAHIVHQYQKQECERTYYRVRVA
mgnify:CR=1 FL=1